MCDCHIVGCGVKSVITFESLFFLFLFGSPPQQPRQQLVVLFEVRVSLCFVWVLLIAGRVLLRACGTVGHAKRGSCFAVNCSLSLRCLCSSQVSSMISAARIALSRSVCRMAVKVPSVHMAGQRLAVPQYRYFSEAPPVRNDGKELLFILSQFE